MTTRYRDDAVTLYQGDALTVLECLEDCSVDACVTSPPYYALRDYGVPPTSWPEVDYAPMIGMPEVTVPPMDCALGLEPDPVAFVGHIVAIMRQVHRLLADDGTLWLNFGDTYAAKTRGTDAGWDKSRLSNPGRLQKSQAAALRRTGERHRGKSVGIGEKNLIGIPWRVAFALQADGWVLRNDVVWAKPNAMPESVQDRLSARHESVFLLTKQTRYWFDLDAIRVPHAPETARRYQIGYESRTTEEHRLSKGAGHGAGGVWKKPAGGRNPGDVWSIATQPFPDAHFAVMPVDLADRCVQAGCRPGGTVLDPFSGSGTTGLAAANHGRRYVGVDLSGHYIDLSLRTRLAQTALLDGEVTPA